MGKQVVLLGINIEISIMNNSITGFHPLYTTRMYLAIIPFTVKMFFFAIKNIGQCCYTPVWVCTISIFLNGFIGSMFGRTNIVKKYELTNCVCISVGQHPVNNMTPDIGPLPLR